MSNLIDIGINMVPIPPEDLVEAGQLAEELGYESLWVGEHFIVPWETKAPYPYGEAAPFTADMNFLEPLAALSALGVATKRVRLGTCIIVLPLRDPYLTARAIVTADILSGGRLEVGCGAGWLKDEFDIVHQDFATRGRRLEEGLALLDELFSASRPQFDGAFWKLPPSAFEPKPKQSPRPPVILGGHSAAALKRAARLADGWMSTMTNPSAVARDLETLRRERGDRAPLKSSVLEGPDADIEAYARVGANRLILVPWRDVKYWREGMQSFAESFGLRASA
jgi:probable F420-dependent oxidoreductase